MNKITLTRLGLALLLVAVLATPPKHAHADKPQEICTRIYASWFQYLERRQCVRDRRKAEKARNCLAKDVERMESLAKEIKESVRESMSLPNATAALQAVMGRKLSIGRAKDDAEDRVVNMVITTKCALAFQFVIQLRAAPSGQLRYLKLWSKFPPVGYPDGYRPAFSQDFEGDNRKRQMEQRRRAAAAANKRARQRLRAEATKRRARETARKRQEAETAKLRRAEATRKLRELRARQKLQAMAAPPLVSDHCAPNLAKQERIRRLRRFGVVRRVGDDRFRAGGHGLGFAAKAPGKAAELKYCK